MDCIFHGVVESWTQLSNFHFNFHGVFVWEKKQFGQHEIYTHAYTLYTCIFIIYISSVQSLSCV